MNFDPEKAESPQAPLNVKNHSETHAVSRDITFRYDLENAPQNKTLFVLTVYGVAMKGSFTGDAMKDKDIMAWSLLPARDHKLEAQLKTEGKYPWTNLATP